MPPTVRANTSSVPVDSLDNIRLTPAKAGLRPTKSDEIGLPFSKVMADAILKHYGSVKAAAISLKVDPSLMMREFEAGKFGRLDGADDDTKAAITDALQKAFGTADPRAKAQRAIRAMRAHLDDLAEAL